MDTYKHESSGKLPLLLISAVRATGRSPVKERMRKIVEGVR